MQPDLFGAPEPRPLAGCVTEPWRQWFSFQRAFDKHVSRARACHQATQPLLNRKRDILHDALRGGR